MKRFICLTAVVMAFAGWVHVHDSNSEGKNNFTHVYFSCYRFINPERDEVAYKACLQEAAYLAGDDALHWTMLARDWANELHDDQEARQCLREAEVRLAKDASVIYTTAVADEWVDLFQDQNQALKLVRAAETAATSLMEYLDIAEFYKEKMGDEQQMLVFMQKSEEAADSTFDWYLISDKYSRYGYSEEAKRAVYEQEKRAGESSYDWIVAAESWMDLFPEETGAARCLEQAIDKAGNSKDWTRIAEFYKEKQQDDEQTLSSLKTAESLAANEPSDWYNIADKYDQLLKDNHEARRLLGIAENKAVDTFNHLAIAHHWRNIDAMPEACRQIKKVIDLAKTEDDWHYIEMWHGMILKNEQEEQQCEALVEAENASRQL